MCRSVFLHPGATSFLSAAKYGSSSVYEHFIHEDSLVPTTIICTIFQQRTSFYVYQENGLNTKYPKGRKRSFWRCLLLQNCFYVTVFTVFFLFFLNDTNNDEICRQ
jgi:hypothetical protein